MKRERVDLTFEASDDSEAVEYLRAYLFHERAKRELLEKDDRTCLGSCLLWLIFVLGGLLATGSLLPLLGIG